MGNAVSMQEAAFAIRAGESVVIVCKSYFEAESCAKELAKKLAKETAVDLRKTRVILGQGCIEFAWLETSSGRRLDDFDVSGFSITDPFHKKSLPIVAGGDATPNQARSA